MAQRLLLVVMLAAAAQAPAFDVVSIKVAEPGARGTPPLRIAEIAPLCTQRLNRFNCTGVTLRALVRVAFVNADGTTVPISQIIGGPDWVKTAQFNIQAETAPGTALSPAEAPPLVRALLEDRFKLKTRTEPRPFPIYALVKARKDGSLGPSLRPSTTACAPRPADAAAQGVPEAFNGKPVCFSGVFRPGTIAAPKQSMESLARNLTTSGGIDRIVVDRSGLSGDFSVDLKWSADASQPSDLPSLFTAIEEQLGLKLEPRTEPLPAVVIDHVEQPTPN